MRGQYATRAGRPLYPITHTHVDLRTGPSLRVRPVHSTRPRLSCRRACRTHFFLLTRVTRIFQKSVFTKTTPERPGGRPRRVFCCADARRPRAAYFFAARQGEKP